MIVGRIVGWFLLAAALLAAGGELVQSLEAGAWRPLGLGAPWFGPDAAGLDAARAALGLYVPEAIAQPVAAALLRWPAWLVLGVAGGLLARLFRSRPRRKRWFS